MRDQYDLAIGTTEAQAADIADDVLVGRFARGWFQANEYWLSEWHPELVAAIQHEFSTTPVAHEYELPSRIRESVRQVVEGE